MRDGLEVECESASEVYCIPPPDYSAQTRVNLEWSPSEGEDYHPSRLHLTGNPLSPTEIARLPKLFTFDERPGGAGPNPFTGQSCVDFLICDGGEFLISRRVRGAIEEIEPGIHQTIPVEADLPISWQDLVPDTQYYLLNCCVRLDAALEPIHSYADITIKKSIANGHNLWMGPQRSPDSKELFISGKLHAILARMAVGPVEYYPCRVV